MEVVKRNSRSMNSRYKRRINRWFLLLISLLIITTIVIIRVPRYIEDSNLLKLGYDKIALQHIRKRKLTKTILKNQYYSEYLNEQIKTDSFKQEYLTFYLIKSPITEDDFLLYDRLVAKGYTEETVLKLFEQLYFYEMTPLLVFDHVEDITIYINDVLANRDKNTEHFFTLTNNYITYYENTEPSPNQDSHAMIVNKHYYLDASFIPKIVPMNVRYASKNVEVEHETANAFMQMHKAMTDAGLNAYIGSGYRDYQYQDDLYKKYVSEQGQEKADSVAARPGHSEHQTGLSIDLNSATTRYNKFGETDEYFWLVDNAHNFGFIIRYPYGKDSITGYSFEAWHWRYVGVELATKVKESNLTYDEYYELYLK